MIDHDVFVLLVGWLLGFLSFFTGYAIGRIEELYYLIKGNKNE